MNKTLSSSKQSTAQRCPQAFELTSRKAPLAITTLTLAILAGWSWTHTAQVGNNSFWRGDAQVASATAERDQVHPRAPHGKPPQAAAPVANAEAVSIASSALLFPEPGTIALLTLGTLAAFISLLALLRRWKRRGARLSVKRAYRVYGREEQGFSLFSVCVPIDSANRRIGDDTL